MYTELIERLDRLYKNKVLKHKIWKYMLFCYVIFIEVKIYHYQIKSMY